MISWRITKYNPKYRNEKDEYQKEEWTSCYDIGRIYEGKEFTINDYMIVEDAYVDALLLFMASANIMSLKVKCLEKNNDSIAFDKSQLVYSEEMIELFDKLYDEDTLEIKDIEKLCRLVLREQLWCKLENTDKIFVHFGYDYYMYIGCFFKPKEITNLVKKIGLFIEMKESPHV